MSKILLTTAVEFEVDDATDVPYRIEVVSRHIRNAVRRVLSESYMSGDISKPNVVIVREDQVL